jgi:hypothetical protein
MNPRLRHIACIARPAAWPGVVRRLSEQARAAQDLRIAMRFTVMARAPMQIPGVDCLAIGPLARFSRCRAILAAGLLDGVDAAILRYPTALDLAPAALLGRYGRRIVSEHHTDEASELRLIGRWPFGALKARMEERCKPAFLRQLAGIIAVTRELCDLESAAAPALPATVIGNGIDVTAQPAHGPAPLPSGAPLRLVWACSEFAPWQGLDRLLSGLAARSTGRSVELVLAGRLSTAQHSAIAAASGTLLEVICRGTLDSAGIDRELHAAHAVLGTLALHRKAMREACPLKVREAVARGLPVINACDDPDLPKDLPGVLRIEAGEEPVDGRSLVERAEVAATDPLVPARLRQHAVETMDWRPKLRRMVDFVAGAVR